MKTGFYVGLGTVLLGLDQWSKLATVNRFSAPTAGRIQTDDLPQTLLPALVEWTRLHNYGAAWGSMAGMRMLLILMTLAVMVGICFVLRTRRHPVARTAGALLLAGGIGNLIDRIWHGYVVDMFHFLFWQSYPVFNVADICVVIGMVLCLLYVILWEDKEQHGKSDTDC